MEANSDHRRFFELLDEADPLSGMRARFDLSHTRIFFNGNSLGPPPRGTWERLRAVIQDEWRNDMNAAWWDNDWLNLPRVTGDRIGRLIGAAPGQVVVGDSTSVNLFKLLCGALQVASRRSSGRSVVLTDSDNFPSDLYIADGIAQHVHPHATVRRVAADSIVDHLGDDVAVVLLSHVDYRSGRLLPMRDITESAHAAGALVLWDLAHSAGVVPIDADDIGIDLAVGCGYKYLNGGPGAPGYMYVASRLLPDFAQPITGWLGHAAPFDFEPDYRPDPGIARLTTGCPPLLSLIALDEGVAVTAQADPHAVRAKSIALAEQFAGLVRRRLARFGVEMTGPAAAAERGSHVSLRYPSAARLAAGLSARGFDVELRPPDLLRFGLAPLYIRYVDVYDCVEAMEQFLAADLVDAEVATTDTAAEGDLRR
ncbi:kynureninase [Nocardia transvalensis]|uniref:kynureninase n=1 Tax=Nocardia transvalensis TaxID=37333 RepID=UPI0018938FE9|nr:aminotransferase class V-fold PLP-dependent enzyme [Nocardia transvalensis]MBF6332002.1 aminotransferase class V-fold PLP-dependent enzyme [Nocardia transvalensis]